MNEMLRNYAVDYLKNTVPNLTTGNQRRFKLMYGRDDGNRSVKDTENMDILSVVDEIPDEKLDWAMQQVMNTVVKNNA